MQHQVSAETIGAHPCIICWHLFLAEYQDIRSPAWSSDSRHSAPFPVDTRICTLETSSNRTAGFAISGMDPPPFRIFKIEKNSPAEKAGLRIDDVLLAINGTSVTEASYEDTIKIIKDALHQSHVQLLVKHPATSSATRTGADSHSSISGGSSSNLETTGGSEGDEPHQRGTNAVQQYQSRSRWSDLRLLTTSSMATPRVHQSCSLSPFNAKLQLALLSFRH